MKRALYAAVGIFALAVAIQTADAADLPRGPIEKAPAAVAPVFNWSGVYIGAHVGYGWGDKKWRETGGGPDFVDYGTDGFLGGGQIGFNVQNGLWVWGVEADVSWTNIEGGIGFSQCGFSCSTEAEWLATLTARLGYAAGPSLYYVKGGAAWIDEEHTISVPIGIGTFTSGGTRSGWTIGAGWEYDFGNNWSAKLEYNYMDFGDERVTFTGLGSADIDQHVHAVKWGINYRFATGIGKTPPPVTARY